MMQGQGRVDVASLVFSYTGTWTDTTMEIGGSRYRVLQLKSNGTLTFDEDMVGKVPFDVWCVRKGETGGWGEDGHAGPLSDNGSYTIHCSSGVGVGGEQGRMSVATAPDGASGATGAAGGWNMTSGVTASALTADVVVNSTSGTSLGNLASVNGTARTGTQWFPLPAGNNGAGGAGGSGGMGVRVYGDCSLCGAAGYTSGPNPGSAGSPGADGIVVIRMLIE